MKEKQKQNQNQNQSLFKSIISLITYKKTKIPPSFTLTESYEESGQEQDNSEQSGSDQGEKEKDEQNSSSKSRRRATKKPLSPSALKSSRVDSDAVKKDIDSNKKILEQQFHLPINKDLIIREFSIGNKQRGFIAYIDGMADKGIINDFILRPLFDEIDDESSSDQQLNSLEDIILTNDTKNLRKVTTTVTEILKGNTALYVDGLDYFITCETIGYNTRGVEAPKTEGIVKGPQEGFSENLRTNISLIRRIVRNKDLITEFHEIGEKSNTTCAVVYLNGVVNPAVVQEVQRRLKNIKTDFLVSSGMLEQLIEDNPYSIVPTILSTERPDRTASHLVEGRVAIIVDGSPFAMIVPVSMHALMHSPEDAALKWQYATSIRFIRFVAVLAASMLPALYIALTTFHREMIPTDLLIAIAKAKENVPFPTLVEILLMELGFELIREAGLRVPGIVGNTLGIIGALILGEAAVSANIVSPILIIIVAITGLSNFAIPNYNLAFGVRLTRFYFIAAGALLGFYGISLALVAYVLMLVNLKSFGVPFISIISPRTKGSRDIIIKWPIWMQEYRPDYLNSPDRRRQPKISRQWAEQDSSDT